MTSLEFEPHVADHGVYRRTVGRFREAGIVLPTFGQLAAPGSVPSTRTRASDRAIAAKLDAILRFIGRYHDERNDIRPSA